MNTISRYFIFLVIILLGNSCAIQIPPAGGDKDIVPPEVLHSDPKNFSTNFNGHEIAITFNEYIQLKEANSQLVVSPPLQKFPEVKIRKKTLFIQFDDTLEANTTYSFNFGNAILDNNEGNVLENYQFVFSTGSIIDSMEISGTVKNASTDKPEKDVQVMLYKGADDSLPFLKRPYYFGKTDADGNYHVRNIAAGSYKIIGLQDINKDYLYAPGDERIAFNDSRVIENSVDVKLRMFKQEEDYKFLRAYSEEPGKVICAFNGVADTLTTIWVTDTTSLKIFSLNYSEKKDTLIIWYQNLQADTIQVLFPQLLAKDTLTIRLLKRDLKGSSRSKPSLRILPLISSGSSQDLHRPFDLLFNHPVESSNLSGIQFLEDSVVLPGNSFYFVDSLHTLLRYSGAWKQKAIYNLLIPSGLFRDIYQLENDTITFGFRTKAETDYASLTANLSSKSGNFPYLIQLVDEQEKVFETSTLNQDSSITFNFLTPGVYRLKIIQDSNRNGRWDSGYYLKKIQPEKVFYYPEVIQIRANWDVEIKWDIP